MFDFLICAALALSANCTQTISGFVPTEEVENMQAVACAVMDDYECPPTVTGMFMEMPHPYWGVYYGQGVVFLNDKMRGHLFDSYARGILVHEIVHYIVRWNEVELTSCEGEEFAWDAFNAYVISVSRDDLINEDWTDDYAGCE